MSSKHQYHSSNYSRVYNGPEFIQQINTSVEKELDRRLHTQEKTEIVNFIRKIDPELFRQESKGRTIDLMIETLVKEFAQSTCESDDPIDTHSILANMIGITSESSTTHGVYDAPEYNAPKQEIPQRSLSERITQPAEANSVQSSMSNIASLLGLQNATEAVRKLNPKSMLRKNYIFLDSRYRILNTSPSEGITKFTWAYTLGSQQAEQGTVNLIGNVRDIIGFRVYPCRIPYVASADNSYARISMLIHDFDSQAFIAHENRKFHFMFRSSIDSDFIELDTDKQNDGYFWFERPVTAATNLSISFGSPLEPITFDNDRDIISSVDYFGITPLTQFTTTEPHNLNNGDRVYFDRFNIGAINPLLKDQTDINNAIKEKMNRSAGFLITVINDNNFSIDFDTSLIQNPLADPFDVYYGSKRLFIPLEITYINPESN
jgi:hypothetical protein